MQSLNNIKIEDIGYLSDLSKNEIIFRKKNLSEFQAQGFPSKTNEEWKFIDLGSLLSKNSSNLEIISANTVNNKTIDNILKTFPIDLADKNYILSIDGFIKKIEIKHEDKKSIKIDKSIDTSKSTSNDPLECLNNALNTDYIKLIVQKDYSFNKPLVILNYSDQSIDTVSLNQKFDIHINKNSNLTLMNFFNYKSKKSFYNFHQHYYLEEGSILKNYSVDLSDNSNLNYIKTNIDLFKNSISENFIISQGSEYSKNEISCNLIDQHSSAFVNGIIKLDNQKKHEIRSKINHIAPNTKSYQLIKCILSDSSKAVYQGKIFVNKEAQKTDGYQLSKAILLDQNTEFNAKPELEIYADDVKCSHGSSSGSLDDNKIFYLMTRGLDKNQSKKMLIDGFILDVIDKITDLNARKTIKNILRIK